MKTILPFLFSVLFSISFSQYTPMLNSENEWVVSGFVYDFGEGQMLYTDYHIKMTDEIFEFNGKEYKGLEQRSRERIEQTPTSDWSDWESTKYYLYESVPEKLVYIYYTDEFDNHESGEFLLYDFNIEIGDFMTFEGHVEGENAEPAEVTDITYETVFGIDNVKTYHFANQEEFQFLLYEGICTTHGLITSSFIWDAGWELSDFGQNLITTTEMNSTKIKIFPNPFTHQIQIESEKPIQQLQLFDSTGKLITSKSMVSELNSDLSQLKSGFYILTITYKDHQTESTKLIKK